MNYKSQYGQDKFLNEIFFFTASLMGGLGNQMFQIAHAMAQGLKNKSVSKFIPFSYTPMQASQPTKYINNIFKNINFVGDLPKTKKIFAPFEFVDLKFETTEPIEFVGYFQSSKNFLGYGEKIKEIFLPTDEFFQKITQKYPTLKDKNTISLHVRRGDYVKIPQILPTLDKSYFDKAIEYNKEYDTLFIFSDDKLWVKENLSYENMIIVDGLEDYEELWMMSLCKNNIISNSSFSWWGAYLNNNLTKKVFAPSLWFGPQGESNYHDIYENNWILINVRHENNKLKYFE
jgi:hypothetical protein